MNDSSNWLTQDAFDRLAAELAEREGPLREEIKKKIAAAREEGDLSENAGYHAARDAQGKNEARVKVLKHKLETAQIGVPASAEGVVSVGHKVTIKHDDGGHETFLLGSREEAAHVEIDVYSPDSPLGKALVGRAVGESATYELPNGRGTLSVTVIEAVSFF
jgi:transcription elongation factor GreA